MDLALLEDKLVEAITKAATTIPKPTFEALKKSKERENGVAEAQLDVILQNIKIGSKKRIPICQDTGTPTFYVEAGSGFSNLKKVGPIIVRAVRRATKETPLRPNAVHPITGKNSGDNTGKNIPYIEWQIADSNELKIVYLPKSGGSENMSQLTMMPPAKGLDGVKEIVLDRVATMKGKPCPPTVVGIGLGGGSNIAMNLAKRALLRPVGVHHEERIISDLEVELKEKLNELGVGPMGLGGKTTVLDVKIEYAHRHPASYPVGIVPQCWANRRVPVFVSADGSIEVGE
ncbi:fumarate hydratase [candidate division MSBL1 archaeon SCGC-AAA261D19]|uniref:Fumarate hydratase n=1 Tax=candidate division MSBL1 archaeon SCGC-AAA261D19 TaxID=1698273 RepID=A0A133V5Z7_9EURY|nr:fumarate hydratase [candidate division MSBL1 archaeon SCGC-AAA261D19]